MAICHPPSFCFSRILSTRWQEFGLARDISAETKIFLVSNHRNTPNILWKIYKPVFFSPIYVSYASIISIRFITFPHHQLLFKRQQ